MGTRSLTAFIEKGRRSVEIALMYRQFDGHPERHGVELAELILNADYNGMGCLAAQVVTHFKTTRDGIYLEPPMSRDMGEEYIYEIYDDEQGNLRMTCYEANAERFIFVGNPKQFIKKYKQIKETA